MNFIGRKPVFSALALAVAASAGWGAEPALAQPSNEAQVETIVVTATRRSENLQKVPISVQSISAASAAKIGVTNPQTLAQVVPGLVWTKQTTGQAPFIRGVGNPAGQVGIESAVATYVDDVYLWSNAALGLGYNGIDRLEVLKGPQGTLFGRNATGGVVNIFTKDPTPERQLDISLGYGNYDTAMAQIYASGAITDKLSANISVWGENQFEGYGKNLTTGHDTYRNWDYGARVKFLLTPSDRTSALLNLSFDNAFNQAGLYFRVAPGTRSNVAPSGSVPPPGIYDSFGRDPFAYINQAQASLKITHETNAFKIISITAYRQSLAHFAFSLDGAPNPPPGRLFVNHKYDVKTTSQEVRILSPDDAPLTWILGVFYAHNDEFNAPRRFEGALFSAAPGLTGYSDAYARQITDTYAGFGQATATVATNTHLTAGLRYTIDKREASSFGFVSTTGLPTALLVSPNSPLNHKWGSLSSRLGLDHQFSDNLMGYVAYNRGYKSGTYNLIVNPGGPIPDPPVNHETLDAYTVGIKSEWFNHRLRANIEGFWYKYKNLQLTQTIFIPPAIVLTNLTNAAQAQMKGVEFDFTLVPVEHLTLSASATVMDGKYKDFPGGQFLVYQNAGGMCGFTALNTCGGLVFPPGWNPGTGTWNLAGNKTVNTPPFSFTLTGNYEIPTNVGDFDITLSWYHSGNYYFDPDNGIGNSYPGSLSSKENDRQGIFNILNGSVSYRTPNGKYEVRVWGKNLTDEVYADWGSESATMIKYQPTAPRTYGFVVTAHL